MKYRAFSGHALVVSAVGTLLAGCGEPPGAIHQSSFSPRLTLARGSAHQTAISGWAPSNLQTAYNLPWNKNGKGQIVAVVEPYDNPNVASDLAEYRSTFVLPRARFTKFNQEGQTYNYPQGNPNAGLQIDVDVDMVSASCPHCTIYLVEANSDSGGDVGASITEAVKLGAHIVSTSWLCAGYGCISDSYFDPAHVTFLATDAGGGPYYPAAFDNVVATGATILSYSQGKRGYADTVWVDEDGGCATGSLRPSWQQDDFCLYRLANDVSSDGTNLAIYDAYAYGGWIEVDAVGASAAFLAGVFGLAGNASEQHGGRTFWQTRHRKYLNSVLGAGHECVYEYGLYSTCTGWGTPNGVGAF